MSNSSEKSHVFRVVGHSQREPQVAEMVSLQLRDLYPMLMDAVDHKRVFLQDFGDDTIKVTRDFYEILITHQRCLRDEAA